MPKLKRFFILATVFACLAPLNPGAFAQDDDDDDDDDDGPPGINVTLFLNDQNVVIQGEDPTGAPLEECQLCTQQMEQTYGPGCENLYLNPSLDPSVNLCEGGNGTILKVDAIETMITRINPLCYLFYTRSLGKTRVFQYCRR
jgi:hypothetical protein